ncbi:MAG: helix-turn-helix transcriptional regulator [Thalassobaculum sp.]|uniref:helix-turn-helix transcriptional regulator n=1 Tax=Thalassobaculum sp. TaxID=2022740 RepID=UPI0032EB1439
MDSGRRPPGLMTTREVAAYLRIKERKVYDLVATGEIPVSRATGKLLFPHDLVEAWVRRRVDYREATAPLMPRPTVFAGSHDPLLDWALRESGSEIATFFDGSLDGLRRLAAGRVIGAGVHLFEPDRGDWNIGHVERMLPGEPVVLMEWARRRQGLVVPAGNPLGIAGIADLTGRRVVARQPGAGSRVLLDHLLARSGLPAGAATLLEPPARSESDVALAVGEGRADAGLAIESVARQHRLEFVPVADERYDLALWRREIFEPPIQRLLALARGDAFRRRAADLGGYDVSGFGTVHRNGP